MTEKSIKIIYQYIALLLFCSRLYLCEFYFKNFYSFNILHKGKCSNICYLSLAKALFILVFNQIKCTKNS